MADKGTWSITAIGATGFFSLELMAALGLAALLAIIIQTALLQSLHALTASQRSYQKHLELYDWPAADLARPECQPALGQSRPTCSHRITEPDKKDVFIALISRG
jgi:hypothetical protein